jgi:hypothetical protein
MNRKTTILAITGEFLRQNRAFRSTGNRGSLVKKVMEILPDVSAESVYRSARYIQNTLGLYKPDVDDKRYETEQEYRDFFKSNNEINNEKTYIL